MNKLKNLILILTGASFFTSALAAAPPNIVLIFTDDQGYADVGCYGAEGFQTPNLDRLAAQGMRFTDFYSANSVCSASRAALLTGRYPPRTTVTGVFFPNQNAGLPLAEVTIAELLKEQGYATACIGKWHLGHKPQFLPTRQGFDTYLGIPYSNDMWIDPEAPLAEDILLREGATVEGIRNGDYDKREKGVADKVPLMRDEVVIEYPVDQQWLTRRYTDEAIRFMHENKDRPFFIYLPHTMPHIPIFASGDFAGKTERGLYGDVIEELDYNVGRLMEALKDLGLEENTLVIYTSDNGPWDLQNGHGGSAKPLRGFKFSTHEGGHRVPAIAHWPNRIPAGSECREVISTMDILPTVAALAGAQVPSDRPVDGHDIGPILFGSKEAKSPWEALGYWRETELQAIRQGPWKLREVKGEIELYNLLDDISESRNLADELPDKVAELHAVLTSLKNL